jgi:hypothetical protein
MTNSTAQTITALALLLKGVMARINPNPDGIRIKCRRCRIRALRILLFASGRRILAIRRRPCYGSRIFCRMFLPLRSKRCCIFYQIWPNHTIGKIQKIKNFILGS